MTSLLLAAASVIYVCTLSAPAAVTVNGDKAEVNRIDELPPSSLAFKIEIRQGKTIDATVTWPNSPLQLEGKAAALSTGRGGVAFVIPAGGPCLFTETSCMSLVHLVDTSPNAATAIVMPTAMSTDSVSKARSPFLVSAVAACTRSGADK